MTKSNLQENNSLDTYDIRNLSDEEQQEAMEKTPHCLKCSLFPTRGLGGYCKKCYKKFVDIPTSKKNGFMLPDDFVALMTQYHTKEPKVYYGVLHDEFQYRDPQDVPMHLRNSVIGLMSRRIDLEPPFMERENFDNFNQGRNFWGETFGDTNTKFGEER